MTQTKTYSLRSEIVDDPDVIEMLRVQSDHSDAFSILIERYFTRINSRFFRQFRDHQLAEDLTQEVFLRLYRHRKRYQSTAKFQTWLFHIVRNVGKNALRRKIRKPILSLNSSMTKDSTLQSSRFLPVSPSPVDTLQQNELQSVIKNAIGVLDHRQRSVIELHCQDCSYAEIATRLAISTKATKSLLYRARIQLRMTLHEYFEKAD